MYYLYVLTELFNDACNGLDVVFQQLPGSSLPVLITFASLEVGDDVIFDSEGLMEEETRGLLLVGQPLFQQASPVSRVRRRGRVSPVNIKNSSVMPAAASKPRDVSTGSLLSTVGPVSALAVQIVCCTRALMLPCIGYTSLQ